MWVQLALWSLHVLLEPAQADEDPSNSVEHWTLLWFLLELRLEPQVPVVLSPPESLFPTRHRIQELEVVATKCLGPRHWMGILPR